MYNELIENENFDLNVDEKEFQQFNILIHIIDLIVYFIQKKKM